MSAEIGLSCSPQQLLTASHEHCHSYPDVFCFFLPFWTLKLYRCRKSSQPGTTSSHLNLFCSQTYIFQTCPWINLFHVVPSVEFTFHCPSAKSHSRLHIAHVSPMWKTVRMECAEDQMQPGLRPEVFFSSMESHSSLAGTVKVRLLTGALERMQTSSLMCLPQSLSQQYVN